MASLYRMWHGCPSGRDRGAGSRLESATAVAAAPHAGKGTRDFCQPGSAAMPPYQRVISG